MSKRDYYEVLNVPRGASDADIKRAYRNLAKQFHPDHNKGDQAAVEKFKEVQEAYDTLSEKEKRDRYDQFGHAGVDPRYAAGGHTHWSSADGETFDFDSIADLFDFSAQGRGGGGGMNSVLEEFVRRAGQGRPVHSAEGDAQSPAAADVEHTITLTFEQAQHGTTLELRLEGPSGKETISVRIPPGVRHGQRIRVRGKGRPIGRKGKAGDLYVVCTITPHRYWERVKDDIYLIVPVTIVEAALGARIDLPTPDGVRTMTLPPGTASGAKLRFSGLAAPKPKDGGRGDFYAVIKIIPPSPLAGEQKRLLEELAATLSASPRDGLWN